MHEMWETEYLSSRQSISKSIGNRVWQEKADRNGGPRSVQKPWRCNPIFHVWFDFCKAESLRRSVPYLSISASLHVRDARDVPFASAIFVPVVFFRFAKNRHPQPIADARATILKIALGKVVMISEERRFWNSPRFEPTASTILGHYDLNFEYISLMLVWAGTCTTAGSY